MKKKVCSHAYENRFTTCPPPEDIAEPENEATPFQKIGTKKLKKIREKAERKAMREVCIVCYHLRYNTTLNWIDHLMCLGFLCISL